MLIYTDHEHFWEINDLSMKKSLWEIILKVII